MNWDVVTVPQGQAKASSLCTSGEEKKYAMSVEDKTKVVCILKLHTIHVTKRDTLVLYILAT